MRLDPHYGLPPIMTAEEVAEFLRTCTETVRRMARAGKLDAIRGLGVTRFRREVVLRLLEDEES
jgi:excisionase family DNA binding protein